MIPCNNRKSITLALSTLGDTPAIYISCLACYNDAYHHGAWIDCLNNDADAIKEAIVELQKLCGHTDNDWAIHDYNGFPKWAVRHFGENPDLDALCEAVTWCNDHQEDDADAWELLGVAKDVCGNGADLDECTAWLDDSFRGFYDSGAEFAEQQAEECGEIPKDMPSWLVIDWEASWNCNLRHDYIEERINGRLAIFQNT